MVTLNTDESLKHILRENAYNLELFYCKTRQKILTDNFLQFNIK